MEAGLAWYTTSYANLEHVSLVLVVRIFHPKGSLLTLAIVLEFQWSLIVTSSICANSFQIKRRMVRHQLEEGRVELLAKLGASHSMWIKSKMKHQRRHFSYKKREKKGRFVLLEGVYVQSKNISIWMNTSSYWFYILISWILFIECEHSDKSWHNGHKLILN